MANVGQIATRVLDKYWKLKREGNKHIPFKTIMLEEVKKELHSNENTDDLMREVADIIAKRRKARRARKEDSLLHF